MYLGLSLGFVYGPVLIYAASTLPSPGRARDVWIWSLENLSIWLAVGWAILLRAEASRTNLILFASDRWGDTQPLRTLETVHG